MVREDDLPQRPLSCDNCTRNRLCQAHELQDEKLQQYYGVNNFQNLFCSSLTQELESAEESGAETSFISADVVGCLLFHHSQQMSCNVHAITAIVSTGDDKSNSKHHSSKDHVISREQKRIATAVYPTASLLNHACDPDVIVR